MSERPSTLLRNQRKHYVKCVDCGCQTLPQNAPREQPWAAAAALYMGGRINDGALCSGCATKRRELLGLPGDDGRDCGTPKDKGGRAAFVPASAATPRRIRINKREYTWDVSTLEALILRWREQFYEDHQNLDAGWWLVTMNDRRIPASDFRSVPISDGDEIFIVLGRGRYR